MIINVIGFFLFVNFYLRGVLGNKFTMEWCSGSEFNVGESGTGLYSGVRTSTRGIVNSL